MSTIFSVSDKAKKSLFSLPSVQRDESNKPYITSVEFSYEKQNYISEKPIFFKGKRFYYMDETLPKETISTIVKEAKANHVGLDITTITQLQFENYVNTTNGRKFKYCLFLTKEVYQKLKAKNLVDYGTDGDLMLIGTYKEIVSAVNDLFSIRFTSIKDTDLEAFLKYSLDLMIRVEKLSPYNRILLDDINEF